MNTPRRAALWALLLVLGACGAPQTRPVVDQMPGMPRSAPGGSGPGMDGTAVLPAACMQTREHRDADYTPGGLYAPGVNDSAPSAALDISGLDEPTPRAEAPSPYGNRSPYQVLGKTYRVLDSAQGYRERGIASWYGQKFHGRLTSSRERYDMCAFSAAHKTLPLPSYARVTNLDNGRSVVVRVNDRGPFHEGRIIDLSYAAAIKLGVDRTGTARVEVQAITDGEPLKPVIAAGRTSVMAPAAARTALPASGQRIVQVGSYAEVDNARRTAAQLKAAGIRHVDIDRTHVQGRKVWRVRIGPVAAKKLGALLDRVHALGFPGARVFSE